MRKETRNYSLTTQSVLVSWNWVVGQCRGIILNTWKMQVILVLAVVCSISCGAASRNIRDSVDLQRPRIFFGDLINAVDFLPIEINVPDTVTGMWELGNNMYQWVSGYFGGGGDSGAGEVAAPSAKKSQKKRTKKLKKKYSRKKGATSRLNF